MSSPSPIVRRRVSRLVDAGVSLDQIESEVIAQMPLTEEERSALWLYAWGHEPHPGEHDGEHVSVPEVPPG